MTAPRTVAQRIRSTRAWRRLVAQVLKEQPLCYLRLDGCTRIATTGDHIIPASIRPDLALRRDNVRGACRSCNYRRNNKPLHRLGNALGPKPKQCPKAQVRRRRRLATPALAYFNLTTSHGRW